MRSPSGHRLSWHFLASTLVLLTAGPRLTADKNRPLPNQPPAVFGKPNPENVQDLRQMQDHVKKMVDRLRPCVVGIRSKVDLRWQPFLPFEPIESNDDIIPVEGSGVLVKDGLVLTAGHLFDKPNQQVQIVLADGRTLKGKTLGRNRTDDTGLIRIIDPGTWPKAKMGKIDLLQPGQWCLSMGHPGGIQAGRPPVVRLGRFLGFGWGPGICPLETDCRTDHGDSGGPLFDMQGQVLGILVKSQDYGNLPDLPEGIAAKYISQHVPIECYREHWQRLAKGELWGRSLYGNFSRTLDGDAYLGAHLFVEEPCEVSGVLPNSPAAKAGLQKNDVVTVLDGQKIANTDEFCRLLGTRKPGNELTLQVRRGEEETLTVRVVLGKKPK